MEVCGCAKTHSFLRYEHVLFDVYINDRGVRFRTDRLLQKIGMCAVGAHIDCFRKDGCVWFRTDIFFRKRWVCMVRFLKKIWRCAVVHISTFSKNRDVCGWCTHRLFQKQWMRAIVHRQFFSETMNVFVSTFIEKMEV